ncbi:HNH endonuclease [Acinetobacter sp. C26M]|uniref:HNH endonuclease n=1 Tax=unclassified Acinetobacter TaxID=196816 RepID=UPI002036A8FF|nr:MULTISPECIES: HNH endonuclease [unclassified Acinetobacter]USA44932.1 HNH endonuclease [Acinetobacter sp. C26M]USA48435.1 HNH endonuclease [Acinetobacter sp. C26G]
MIFSENYKSEVNLILDKRIYLGEKGKCRYCGKSAPAVTFKKIAHAIPELLGNKFLFSNDECDICNSYFDKHLENNLANFLGVSRTTSQISGKKGVPNTKSSGGDRIEAINGDIVIIHSEESEILKPLDHKTVMISSSSTTYVPINVYKCLVKIALSAMPAYALKGFNECFRWIRYNEEPAKFDSKTLTLNITMVPGINPFRKLWLQIYKRTGDKGKFPYMICIIAFSNYMFQFVIPFNKKDKYLNQDKIQIPIFPMLNGLILPGQAPNIKPSFQSVDLSGKSKVSTPNVSYMHIEKEEKLITPNDLPEEIKRRIKSLGLEFKI